MDTEHTETRLVSALRVPFPRPAREFNGSAPPTLPPLVPRGERETFVERLNKYDGEEREPNSSGRLVVVKIRPWPAEWKLATELVLLS